MHFSAPMPGSGATLGFSDPATISYASSISGQVWRPGRGRPDGGRRYADEVLNPVIALIACALAAVAILVSSAVSRVTRSRLTGPLVILAMTPLVPRVEMGMGLSLDDVLPVVGLTLLGTRLRRVVSLRALLDDVRPSVRMLLGGLFLLLVAGLVSSFVNAPDVGTFMRYVLKSTGRYAFLALIGVAVAAAVNRHRLGPGVVAMALAVMGSLEAAFGLMAFLVPLPSRMGLSGPRPRSVLFDDVPGRVSGTLGLSPNFTGAVLMVTFIITVGIAAGASNNRARLAWAAAASLQLVVLALTFSRAPLALAVAGVAVVIVLSRRAFLLVPMAAVLVLVAVSTPLLGRFLSDATDRLALWYSAATIMFDHPLGGVGPGQMTVIMRANPERYMDTPLGRAVSSAHNTILLAGAETGILGALGGVLVNIALAVLAVMTIRMAVRNEPEKSSRIAGGVASLCFLVQGMVNNLFTVGVTSVMAAVLIGAFLLAQAGVSARSDHTNVPQNADLASNQKRLLGLPAWLPWRWEAPPDAASRKRSRVDR